MLPPFRLPAIENVGVPGYAARFPVDDSGYRLEGDSRELYHEHHDDDPAAHVTELQVAIAR